MAKIQRLPSFDGSLFCFPRLLERDGWCYPFFMAAKYDFTKTAACYQGDTFRRVLRITGDYSDCDFAMQVRPEKESETEYIDASTTNGQVSAEIDPDDAEKTRVTITVQDDVIALIPEGVYVYDFQLTTPGSEVTTFLSGKFQVVGQVTR